MVSSAFNLINNHNVTGGHGRKSCNVSSILTHTASSFHEFDCLAFGARDL